MGFLAALGVGGLIADGFAADGFGVDLTIEGLATADGFGGEPLRIAASPATEPFRPTSCTLGLLAADGVDGFGFGLAAADGVGVGLGFGLAAAEGVAGLGFAPADGKFGRSGLALPSLAGSRKSAGPQPSFPLYSRYHHPVSDFSSTLTVTPSGKVIPESSSFVYELTVL